MRFRIIYIREACRWMGDILGEALADCLRNLGFEATCTMGAPFEPEDSSVAENVIFMGLESIGCLGFGWRGRLGTVFLYNCAETDENATCWRAWRRRLAKNYERTDVRIDAVLDYSERNRENLRRLGFEKVDVPIGYHESFDFAAVQRQDRFDWTFVGRVSQKTRRSRMLGPLCQEFPNHFLQAWGNRNYFAMTREGLCLSGYDSLVTMAIHRMDSGSNFPSCRVIMMAMANRQAVVNEESHWIPDVLEPGVHWLNVPTDEVIPETIKLIQEPERAKEMGLRAWEVIRKQYRLQDHLERGLKEFGIL